jgi:hypothetical protein
VIKWRQAGQSSGLTTIELAKLGHLRKQERSRACTDAADCSELLCFLPERLVLRDELADRSSVSI